MRLFRKLPILQRRKQNLPFANKHWREGVMWKLPHITLHFEYCPTLKDRMCVAWIENKNEVLIWKHGHKSFVLNLSYHKTGSKMDLRSTKTRKKLWPASLVIKSQSSIWKLRLCLSQRNDFHKGMGKFKAFKALNTVLIFSCFSSWEIIY